MKNTGQTILNLRTLVRETLLDAEKQAKTTKDFLEIEALIKVLKEMSFDIEYTTNKLLDLSIENLDKSGSTIKTSEAKSLVNKIILDWKT